MTTNIYLGEILSRGGDAEAERRSGPPPQTDLSACSVEM